MAYRATTMTKAKKEATQSRVFESAKELLIAHGFAGVQMKPLAEAADVATGTAYRYYASRAELCCVLFRHFSQREVDHLGQQFELPGTALERLERGMTSFIDRALTRPTLAYALIAEPVDPSVEAERLTYREHYAAFYRSLILAGIEEGSMPDQDATISAHALVGTLGESLIRPAHQGIAAKDLPALRDAIITFCLRAVTGANP